MRKRLTLISAIFLIISLITVSGCKNNNNDMQGADDEIQTTVITQPMTSAKPTEIATTIQPTTAEPESTSASESTTQAVQEENYIAIAKELTGHKYVYRIPSIMLGSEDAEKVNREILDNYDNFFNNPEYIEEVCYGIDYEYFVNSNILSLVVWGDYMNDYRTYKVYNFDITTGEQIGNEKIAKAVSKDYSQLKEKIKNIIINDFTERYSSLSNYNDYQVQYQRNIDNSNVENAELYLAENNKLMVRYKEFAMVGSEAYYYITEIE
ncbi:MAG: hypothetical protein MJ089_05995 [Ruminococcus sp.]|nr:hypothetical protein [Ruminococcus sp.]